MRVTIKDIAKMAGVTFATVSKALNNQPGVSDEKRKQIVEIAKRMNYVPNLAAKRLVDSNTKSLGVIWPPLKGLFFYHLLMEIQEQAYTHGYTMMVSLADPVTALNSYTQHFIDKVICWSEINWHTSAEYIKAYEQFHGTMILLGGSTLERTHSVGIARREGMFKAVKYLSELGHKRITFFGHKNIKRDGFTQAVLEFQLEYHPNYIVHTLYNSPFPEEQLSKILTLPLTERPTAFIVDSQEAMFDFMRLIRKYKIRIPEDMSVIVYDDVPELEGLLEIPFTVVGPNVKELASTALAIIDKSTSENNEEFISIEIVPELKIRESTRAL